MFKTDMIKPEKSVVMASCGYCSRRYPFTPEFFSCCNECFKIYCSSKCVYLCESCNKNLCVICDEDIQRKHKTIGHKCQKCAQLKTL